MNITNRFSTADQTVLVKFRNLRVFVQSAPPEREAKYHIHILLPWKISQNKNPQTLLLGDFFNIL